MQEIVLKTRKNGMLMLILLIFVSLIAIAATVVGGIMMDGDMMAVGIPLFAAGLLFISVGWVLFLGFRVLRPQEALVLTVFGKYVGTLKGDGFYYVNPFSVAVNPAAKTRLNQSGDVTTATVIRNEKGAAVAEIPSNKVDCTS